MKLILWIAFDIEDNRMQQQHYRTFHESGQVLFCDSSVSGLYTGLYSVVPENVSWPPCAYVFYHRLQSDVLYPPLVLWSRH